MGKRERGWGWRESGQLTSHDVARLFAISVRTATRWMDAGLIEGWRFPMAGRDRRTTAAAVLRFCREHKVPVPLELPCGLLCVGVPPAAEPPWPRAVDRPACAVEAALWLGQRPYEACLWHCSAGRGDARLLGRALRAVEHPARLVYLAGDDETAARDLEAAGWAVLSGPCPDTALAALTGRGDR